jgi:hypothetical protein
MGARDKRGRVRAALYHRVTCAPPSLAVISRLLMKA